MRYGAVRTPRGPSGSGSGSSRYSARRDGAGSAYQRISATDPAAPATARGLQRSWSSHGSRGTRGSWTETATAAESGIRGDGTPRYDHTQATQVPGQGAARARIEAAQALRVVPQIGVGPKLWCEHTRERGGSRIFSSSDEKVM